MFLDEVSHLPSSNVSPFPFLLLISSSPRPPPFLPFLQVTVAKIRILGYDFKKELLEQVAPENLPEEFGGTCRCDGGCRMSDVGLWTEVGGVGYWGNAAWDYCEWNTDLTL